jgi:hypothetical protein
VKESVSGEQIYWDELQMTKHGKGGPHGRRDWRADAGEKVTKE